MSRRPRNHQAPSQTSEQKSPRLPAKLPSQPLLHQTKNQQAPCLIRPHHKTHRFSPSSMPSRALQSQPSSYTTSRILRRPSQMARCHWPSSLIVQPQRMRTMSLMTQLSLLCVRYATLISLRSLLRCFILGECKGCSEFSSQHKGII